MLTVLCLHCVLHGHVLRARPARGRGRPVGHLDVVTASLLARPLAREERERPLPLLASGAAIQRVSAGGSELRSAESDDPFLSLVPSSLSSPSLGSRPSRGMDEGCGGIRVSESELLTRLTEITPLIDVSYIYIYM